MKASNSPRSLAIALLILLSFIWGSSFMLMNFGLRAFSPLQVAAIRLVVAALILSPFLFRFFREVNAKQLLLLALIGFTGNGLPAYLFVEAQTVIPTSVSGVLNTMTPMFTVLLAFLFFKAKFPWISVVGLFFGLVGAVLLVTAGAETLTLSGEIGYSLLIVLATINYAISLNLTKHFFQDKDPILITTFALVSMGIPAAIYLLASGGFVEVMTSHPMAWSSLGFITLLGAVGTAFAVVIFYKMLQISNIIFATSVTYTIPIVAVGWGVFLLGEQLNWQHYLGFAVVIAGVYLVNYSRR